MNGHLCWFVLENTQTEYEKMLQTSTVKSPELIDAITIQIFFGPYGLVKTAHMGGHRLMVGKCVQICMSIQVVRKNDQSHSEPVEQKCL